MICLSHLMIHITIYLPILHHTHTINDSYDAKHIQLNSYDRRRTHYFDNTLT